MDKPWEKAVSVRVVRPYVIDVVFEDGVRRTIDLESELWGSVFEPLRDYAVFQLAAIDSISGSVYWPTGADLAPEFLYYGDETPYGRTSAAKPEKAAIGGQWP